MVINFDTLKTVCKHCTDKGCAHGRNFGNPCDFSVCPLISIQQSAKLLAAIHIAEEMQKWRRERPPYDGETPENHREMPYSAKSYGEALDIVVNAIKEEVE